MKIDIARYCSLSKRADFQNFIKNVNSSYYDELIHTLRKNAGCGANKKTMLSIHQKLINDGREFLLIQFLHDKYPSMVIHEASDNVSKTTPIPKNKQIIEIKSKQESIDYNHHKVFAFYKPGLMLLPQQMILISEEEQEVYNMTINFIRNKISTDYIILKGDKYWHSYIEFFDKRFANDVDKVLKENRPIFLYKKKYKLK